MTPEEIRLQQDRERTAYWKRWEPYLSERQWGTVREDYSRDGSAWDYFSHDQARSRSYRWGKEEIVEPSHQGLRIKIDPGAKTTGLVILRSGAVLWAAELTHRGFKIRDTLTSRRQLSLPIETGTGGRTKYNRCRQNLPKTHWLDAANVGASTPDTITILVSTPFMIKATGHGNRQMCGTNAFGFPIRHRSNTKKHFGFKTGDIVKAVVTKGKKVGSYVGRVLCRATGSFDITTATGRVAGISHKYCSFVHRSDGYAYQ